jgi:DNA (cytosine-5)-methyltransferase 1
MTHGSLFSGIGGFDLAAEWMGWENVFHCEYDPFCQKVLKHHFPNSKLYEDIKTFDATDYSGRIDILTGGFPCQPFSTAGKREGTKDNRHLFPEMLRVIQEVKPKYVLGENVSGLLNWSGGMVFDEVCADLEAEGYEVVPVLLPASGKNAPHLRNRIWFVAHSNFDHDRRTPRQNESESRKERLQERNEVRESTESGEVFGSSTNPNDTGCTWERELTESATQKRAINSSDAWGDFPTQSALCRRDDGFPEGLDGISVSRWRNQSLKSYGNAIVPQVAHEIFKAIQKMEDLDNKPN